MERLARRIHQLELGEEVAAKAIKALLSAEQLQQHVDALAAQVELKKNKLLAVMQSSKRWGGNQSEW